MSGVSVQYSNNLINRNVFKCKVCGNQLLMFGCNNPNCSNFQDKIIKKGVVE